MCTTNTTHTVQGMTCTSCAGKVTAAVAEVAGVENTEVDLASGTLTVTGQEYDDNQVRAAITAAGYRVA
ncbi:heavy metal-associated domain-containing protein [Nocardioides sp. InS609-2]|uniref:heavy-metal-associated domain-containing protein n=1 Tax=Nocardioides sp. InS609-2 TaxID=2760705 RepID=UPI00185AA6FF|nr:heavy metal-associated domain-containing protein [Nocardioides sp. InS609-2]MBA3783602.1 heavy-metal-associated domain-containing protein [Nocardioides sp.]